MRLSRRVLGDVALVAYRDPSNRCNIVMTLAAVGAGPYGTFSTRCAEYGYRAVPSLPTPVICTSTEHPLFTDPLTDERGASTSVPLKTSAMSVKAIRSLSGCPTGALMLVRTTSVGSSRTTRQSAPKFRGSGTNDRAPVAGEVAVLVYPIVNDMDTSGHRPLRMRCFKHTATGNRPVRFWVNACLWRQLLTRAHLDGL